MNYSQTIDQQIESGHAQFAALVDRFPTVRTAPGAKPWDAEKVAAWATTLDPFYDDAAQQSAAFLLSVWEGRGGSREPQWFNEGVLHVGNFDPVFALRIWDALHKRAFLEWCLNPFWP